MFVCKEKWKPIKNFPHYKVSNLGRFWSMYRNKYLKLRRTGGGYFSIALYENGVRYQRVAHLYVIEAFKGPCPPGYECNHKNGKKMINVIWNLEWLTRSANAKHAFKLGLRTSNYVKRWTRR